MNWPQVVFCLIFEAEDQVSDNRDEEQPLSKRTSAASSLKRWKQNIISQQNTKWETNHSLFCSST